MNIDKKLLPAPKPSYTEQHFDDSETARLIKITTIDVLNSNFDKGIVSLYKFI